MNGARPLLRSKHAFPRSRDRGPIEEYRIHSLTPVSPAHFRDREIAAPLKISLATSKNKPFWHFRDREIAAPLKNCRSTPRQRSLYHFRDREIAAPLKTKRTSRSSFHAIQFPRSRDRGPIEDSVYLFRNVCDIHISAIERSRPH